MGYAEATGLPNEMGLVKNQYIARTFIEPTQERRERAVRMKLSAVPSVVAGKCVVLVDVQSCVAQHQVPIVKMLQPVRRKFT